MIVVSLAFQLVAAGTPLVVIALQIASFTYGGLLGGFLLGLISRRAEGRDALTGMGIAVAAMASLWAAQQFGAIPRVVDTLWFALIGSAITVCVGEAERAAAGVSGERSDGPSPARLGSHPLPQTAWERVYTPVRAGERSVVAGRAPPSPDPPPQTAWGRENGTGECASRTRRSPPLPYRAGTRGCRQVVYGRGGRGVRAPPGAGGPGAVRVRDARPQGREPGAAGHSRIVP